MILITGAAGFIGSAMLGFLNQKGFNNIMIVDKFEGLAPEKLRNLEGRRYALKLERDQLFSWLLKNGDQIEFVFHLGARTDTMETDTAIFDRLNLNYSQSLFQFCAQYQIPIIYASSAATYGDGKKGYSDRTPPADLQPLNAYARSKNDFDYWADWQNREGDEWDLPPFWAGVKFFNVFGANEYHKGRMASVVFHAFEQIQKTGKVELFRSYKPEIADGEQKRDFIYIADLCEVLYFMMQRKPVSGIYNLGTGKARSFIDLAKAVFAAMKLPENIAFIDMPEPLSQQYQYFTEAQMQFLRKAGYKPEFTTLEASVADYVQNYLLKDKAIR